MVDGKLLIAEIEEVGIPKTVLAAKCKISRQTLDYKLGHPNAITADEACLMAKALRITDTDRLMAIFFADEVE